MLKVKETVKNIKSLYLEDERPWIIGLSGGKDSTCVTQLVYNMIKQLKPQEKKKKVHILSSDTLVESPFIHKRIINTINKINVNSKKDNIPIKAKILTPELTDTFWVNIIGRGYPSPNKWFRWCTDRLKIKPMSKYIFEQVKINGEVIILLGARKSESASRAQTMSKFEIKDFNLRKHNDIDGAFIYTPIEDWDLKEVWAYLLQVKSPWGDNNRELIDLYKRTDEECPLVIDKSTPACGSSRFGCWTCTVVNRDRALEGLIEDGEVWAKPLLEFRNWLKEIRDDPLMREKIRKSQKKKKIIADFWGEEFNAYEHRGHQTLGPFTLNARYEMFRRLMELNKKLSKQHIELISSEEIKAIQTIWAYEGGNIESIQDIIDKRGIEHNTELKEKFEKICEDSNISPDLIQKLLIVENDYSNLSRRKGLYNRLERVVEEYIFSNIEFKNEE